MLPNRESDAFSVQRTPSLNGAPTRRRDRALEMNGSPNGYPQNRSAKIRSVLTVLRCEDAPSEKGKGNHNRNHAGISVQANLLLRAVKDSPRRGSDTDFLPLVERRLQKLEPLLGLRLKTPALIDVHFNFVSWRL